MMEKVVKRCRRCGTVFAQTARPRIYKISATAEAYTLFSYCYRCRRQMSRAARACDPRYTGVGGHGDILEAGR
ncbi:MAG: hypothetical protein IKO72_00650 [Kiritimatiellae bacterium]|nr:hypothetical protein [Kiritimatiellia bacterium]